MSGGKLSAAFHRWTEYVREKADLTRGMQNIMRRITAGTVCKSWNAWMDAVEELRQVMGPLTPPQSYV